MKLKDILAISGYPGLYKFLSQTKNGIIVESLIDKKRFPAYASAKVSALEDVAIFTTTGETPLKEVLSKIYEKEQGGPAINPKTVTNDELKAYFSSVLPEYNSEKVYVSDIRKVLLWYNLLQQLDLLNLPEDEETVKSENHEEKEEKKGLEEKKVKKSKKKSA
jgi:hypothetical protein